VIVTKRTYKEMPHKQE